MRLGDIKNKKIELFADNGIDNYRKTEEITIKELLKMYLENDGFFILEDKNHSVLGYLDAADLDKIKKLIEDPKVHSKTIKDIKNSKKILLREEYIQANETIAEVISKIEKSGQKFFPIIKNGVLIGRISKSILKRKIKDLY